VALTLSGSNTGANIISGAITDGSGTVSLTRSGTGNWTLSGSNTYSGINTLSGGVTTVTNTHGLGSNTSAGAITFGNNSVVLNLLNEGTGSTGTIVYGPGSGYNVTTTKTDIINVGASTSTNTGNTIQLGSLSNTNGSLAFTNSNGYNLTFTGTTSIGTNVSFTNNMTSGTVTFASGIVDTDTSASRSITFTGTSSSATTVVAGIAPGSGTNTLSLGQFGPGTLDLTAASTYNGSTTILGGTVILANATGTGLATSALTLGGGTLSDIGTSTTAPTIGSGTTTISAGSNTVSTSTTTGHILALGALSRSNTSGAVVNFVPTSTITGAAGSITTTTGNTNGTIGGWATVNGSDWAAVNGTTITAYNNYTGMITSGTGTTSNYQITNGSGTTTLTGVLKIASLKITDTGTTGVLNMGADSLSFNVGNGLLYTGGGSYTINGTAAIGAGTSSGAEFFVNVNNTSTLTINAPVIGSGSGILTKAGNGTLILTATNSAYQQATNIDGGNLQISSLGNSGTASSIGTGSAGGIVLDSGTLTYVGGTTSTNRTFTFNSNGGEIDSSGTGALSITTGTITPANNSTAGVITMTLGGTNTGANTISSSIANAATITVTGVTKTGAGTWVLSGSNSYTGATTVNAGTLSVTGTINSGSAVAVNGGTLSVAGSVTGAISVAHGATLSGNGGTLGAVTVAGGGIINTQDGVIGTLNGSTLTLTSGGGNAVLDLDLGGSLTADLLNFSGIASMGNNFTVNVNGISGATTGTYTIATAAGGGLLASEFASGTVGGTLSGGDTMSFLLSGNSIELVIGTGSVTSTNYYFTGTNSNNFTDAGNYFTAATGGTQQSTALSSTSNVFLNANTASNTPDTLSGSASINSLNIVTAGTSLAGSGTVTLAATGTAGITDSAGTLGPDGNGRPGGGPRLEPVVGCDGQ
jgi:fibronectin-binding autotransporter adhesin